MRRTGRRPRPLGSTPATVALDAAGVTYAMHAYEHDPAAVSYGLEAAEALGVDPARVLKTLLVEVDGGPGGLVVGVVPVDRTLDLKALAAVVGAKRAAMAPPQVAERATGSVVGGISPVGMRRRLPTVVDDRAAGFATVLVSGGRRGLDVELTPQDLLAVTEERLAMIAR